MSTDQLDFRCLKLKQDIFVYVDVCVNMLAFEWDFEIQSQNMRMRNALTLLTADCLMLKTCIFLP